MTAIKTTKYLETYSSGQFCYVLAFDGFDLLCTTSNDPTGIATAWADTEWTHVQTGLMQPPVIKQTIKLFDPQLQPETLTFTVLDESDDLLRSILREGNNSDPSTLLAASITANDGTIAVQNTDFMPSSGAVWVGSEAITYGSKSGSPANTLNDITRGKWSLFGTQDDDAHFGRAHYIRGNATAPSYSDTPSVNTFPKIWVGRTVALYMHHKTDDGSWSKRADAHLCWVGTIESYGDQGDYLVAFNCRNITNKLTSSVMRNQWQGTLRDHSNFFAGDSNLWLYHSQSADDYDTDKVKMGLETASTNGDGLLNHADVAAVINKFFASLHTTNPAGGDLIDNDNTWTIGLETDPQDKVEKYVIRCRAATGHVLASSFVFLFLDIGLSAKVWTILGWDPNLIEFSSGTFGFIHTAKVPYDSSVGDSAALWAPQAPVSYQLDLQVGGKIQVYDEAGTWVNQTAGSINADGPPAECEGFVLIDNVIVAVSYDGTSIGGWRNLTVYGVINTDGLKDNQDHFGTYGYLNVPADQLVVRGDSTQGPIIKQIYYEKGTAGKLLLQLLLSTGVPGYNDSLYDVYEQPGLGLAFPRGLVDVASFENLDSPMAIQMCLLLVSPTPFSDIMSEALSITGRYLVFKTTAAGTKLSIAQPGQESPYVEWAYLLNESNKAETQDGKPDRVTVDRASDNIINGIELEYFADAKGENSSKVIVNDLSSQSDFEIRHAAKIKAPHVRNGEELINGPAGPALAYFSRPLAIVERSYDYSLIAIAPGDVVLLSDNYMADPTTGIRGITGLPCWVLSTSWDPWAMRGRVQLVFTPEQDSSKIAPWSPSARIDTSYASSGFTHGYKSSTKTMALLPYQYSQSAAIIAPIGNDPSYFKVGDNVHIASFDGAFTTTDEITAVDHTSTPPTITLFTGLSGYDTSLEYFVESITYGSIQPSQHSHAYDADFSDNLILDDAASTAYRYGIDTSGASLVAAGDIPYDHGFLLQSNQDADGTPASIHRHWHWVESLDALYGYRTNQNSSVWYNDGPYTTSTGDLTVLATSIWVPLYGCISNGAVRSLKVKVLGNSGHASKVFTITVASSNRRIGSVFNAPDFTGAELADVSRTGTANAWTSEVDLTPVLAVQGGQIGTWITVIGFTQDNTITGSLYSLAWREGYLS